MIQWFCLECFGEVEAGARRCPWCGADLNKSDAQDFDGKLIRALDHRLSDRRILAVRALGARRTGSAVPSLVRLAGHDQDPYVAAEAVRALTLIGHPEGLEVVRRMAGEDCSVVVKSAARESLGLSEDAPSRPPDPGPSNLVPTRQAPQRRWANRNVLAMGATSFLSDTSHEMATSLLPGFLASIGAPAVALGVIEGVSDALSSFAKLGGGWLADRTGRRKEIAGVGYAVTGVAFAVVAVATVWPVVLLARAVAWVGRGGRRPARDAMLASSVPGRARGRAFGVERAADTFGAVVGPALGVVLLALFRDGDPARPFRLAFLLTVVPGLAAAAVFWAFVRNPMEGRMGEYRFLAGLRNLPGSFRRYLVGVGLFGMGDFAPTFLILGATALLEPSRGLVGAAAVAGGLYVLRNLVQGLASVPVGALSDRWGRRRLLVAGYVMGALVPVGFAVLFLRGSAGLGPLMGLFAAAGLYMAVQETLEAAVAADLTDQGQWGLAQGALGSVNGVGDLVASVTVGALWTAASPAAALAFAAGTMGLGAAALAWALGGRRAR
jgi:MFS family permease